MSFHSFDLHGHFPLNMPTRTDNDDAILLLNTSQDTDELVVNTPSPLAQKYWITNGACHAKWIVVFAQLHVGGNNEGIHGVLVRCRDDKLGVSSHVLRTK